MAVLGWHCHLAELGDVGDTMMMSSKQVHVGVLAKDFFFCV